MISLIWIELLSSLIFIDLFNSLLPQLYTFLNCLIIITIKWTITVIKNYYLIIKSLINSTNEQSIEMVSVLNLKKKIFLTISIIINIQINLFFFHANLSWNQDFLKKNSRRKKLYLLNIPISKNYWGKYSFIWFLF